ncbi:MAG TPA: hypothetical protein VG815_03495 [Chloroflexota bacterium]|jgi:hypothetical protein|nr:hypothetical protein [Chloroflexota bacterium]
MLGRGSYGILAQTGDDIVEFTVDGRVQRAWRLIKPITSMSDLMQRCLATLGDEGWRPISHHQSHSARTVVVARVPYTAGSKLASYGTLRHVEGGTLVLTVGGAVMKRWDRAVTDEDVMANALADLEHEGWRVHRRYRNGATVVRG